MYQGGCYLLNSKEDKIIMYVENIDITLKKLEEYKLENFELIAKWYNDEEIIYFITPNRGKKEIVDVNGHLLLKNALDNHDKCIYFIMKSKSPIGIVTIIKNFEYLTDKDEKTAWISICIGEKEYWGKGISKEAMRLVEDECRKLGFHKIELGVFGFNYKAIKLYKKMDYKELEVISKFTYLKGKWYEDIRMLKIIK